MAEKQTTTTKVPFIYYLLSLVFYGLTIKVLYDLQKTDCKCKDDSRHKYVIYYMYYAIAMIVLGIFGLGLHKYMHPLFLFTSLVYTITMCFVTTLYLRKMSTPECDCESSDMQRYIRYIWYFNSAMMLLMIVSIIVAMINRKSN